MTGVTQMQKQAIGAMPQNQLTSSRSVIATENGLVNKEKVREIMEANIAPDAPSVKSISSNQS